MPEENIIKSHLSRFGLSGSEILGIAIVSTGFVFFHYTTFAGLVGHWENNNTYSFGYVVPLISIYLVWMKRYQLAALDVIPSPLAGFILLGVSVFLSVSGMVGGILIVQEIALLLAIPALVLIYFGKHIAKALLFPMSYLIFMLPVWTPVIEKIQFPSQVISARIASWLLQTIGIPAFYHDGIYIEIPNMLIEIARACSGVNFLIAILAIGIPVAVLHFDSWIKRIILLTVSVLIAVAGNGLRAALIALFAYKGYSSDIHGPYHFFYGYFVSGVGLAILFTGVFLFGKRSSPGVQIVERNSKKARISVDSGKRWVSIIAATLLFILAGAFSHYRSPQAVLTKNHLSEFPYVIGMFNGIDIPPLIDGFTQSGADTTISRLYTDESGKEYFLFIGYYSFQSQGKKMIDYRIRDIIIKSKTYLLGIDQASNGKLNAFVEKKKENTYIVMYWFHLNGKNIADAYIARLDTVFRGLIKGETNGAVVVVATADDSSIGINEQIRNHAPFVGEVASLLDRHLKTY